ncbi:MAG: radical SAM family heme chaperone HemW [Massiliimalia sp.]|jgi:oxygen-independent coproporphyrinogen-3 oxidase
MSGIGIYVHVPFCRRKCPYCDFYSVSSKGMDAVKQQYTDTVCRSMEREERIFADTLYFGGGTPVQLSPDQIGKIIDTAKNRFGLSGEITAEANPGEVDFAMLYQLREAGVNRLSFGMQSAKEEELRVLGRRHSAQQVKEAVTLAKQAGFDNLSVDIMLGVPKHTLEHLERTLCFLGELDIQHVSAYMLKIEEGTPFAHPVIEKMLPDEDLVCDSYLLACQRLEEMGFSQYEISNFAKPGWESRHNLKYWNRQEYMAFGPSAHGFQNGVRYYYPRDLEAYLTSDGTNRLIEEDGVDPLEESVMLGLRLKAGIFPKNLFENHAVNQDKFWKQVERYCAYGLMCQEGDRIFLTPKGFLVSNSIIAELELMLDEGK